MKITKIINLVIFKSICALSNDDSKKYLVTLDNANQEINKVLTETNNTLTEFIKLYNQPSVSKKQEKKVIIDMLINKNNTMINVKKTTENLAIEFKNIEQKIKKCLLKKEFIVTQEDELLINNEIAYHFNEMDKLISTLNGFMETLKNVEIRDKEAINAAL